MKSLKPFRIRSKLTVRDTDPLVREHRVHDIHILPGVSLLDATYKTLAAAKWQAESVVLRNILFYEPVVTHAEMDRHLTVTIEMDAQKGSVTVTSVPAKDGKPLSEDSTLHMTCTMEHAAEFELESLPHDFASRVGETLDLDSCYSVTRHIGIFHDSFMKCVGSVASLSEGACVATVSLGERAAGKMHDFMLHPVFLDCSTIVPLFNLRDRLHEANLFIPFAIEEFRARPLSGIRQLRVVVEKSDVGNADQEILRYSSTLYDSDGQALARIRNFGVKRVRSLDGIHRLLAFGTSARSAELPVSKKLPASSSVALPIQSIQVASAVQPSQQVQPVAQDAQDEKESDAILALIGKLIVQCGSIPWNTKDAQTQFFDLGLDSLALLEMSEELEKKLNIRLYPTLLFECPTAAQLVAYLRENFPDEIALAGGELSAVVSAKSTDASKSAKAIDSGNAAMPPSVVIQNAEAPQILVPRWMPLLNVSQPESSVGKVALLGCAALVDLMEELAVELGERLCHRSICEKGGDISDDLKRALENGIECDEIWLVEPDHRTAFTLIKTLRDCGRLESTRSLKAITFNAFSIHGEACSAEAGHGVWGLWQTVSREYPNIKTALLDLDRATWRQSVATSGGWQSLCAQQADAGRDLRAIRRGRSYVRNLYGVQPSDIGESKFRQGGAYLVIGGAGGVGLELAAYLHRRYGAKVAIAGRSELDGTLLARLAGVGEYGRDVLYVRAAVDDGMALTQAIESVRQHFGALHGIVHSAMVLDDKRLSDMSDESFARVLQPKVEGARILARITADMPLDFLLFFSSMQSFVGNVSQGNYAAASTFLDGFAASMRVDRSYPVVVVNWGFWSEVGAVATSVYRNLLTRQGLYGLRTSEALEKLEHVLSTGYEQALIVAAEEQVLQKLGLKRDIVLSRAARNGEALAIPVQVDVANDPVWCTVFADTDQAMQELLGVARRRVVQVLRDLGLSNTEATAMGQDEAWNHVCREHTPLVQALLRQLSAINGFDEEGLDERGFAEALAKLTAEEPRLGHFIPLLQAGIGAYPEILRGQQSAADVLFPGGSPALVRAVYGQSDISRYYNEKVANTVLAMVSGQTLRPVRILEIGAGTGATSVEVLRVLEQAGIECEYRYTDLWDKLVNEARDTLGPQYPNMGFGFLDIGTDPARQGMHETFDIIVATNVLHATRDLRLALRHVKTLLREGGALVMNESVQVQEFSTYTFGLLPGWWSATDRSERLPDSPLATDDSWIALLEDETFIDVRALIKEDATIAAMNAQQIFVATSDGETRHANGPRLVFERQAPVQARQLPPSLADKLHPYTFTAQPQLRYLHLFTDERDHLWLFLDHPPANTFTNELLGELCSVLRQLAAPTGQRRRLVYISHFGEYFSLGGDRGELVQKLAAGEIASLRAFAEKARELLHLLASLDAIVVAVANGTAQGGGLETLMATDIQFVREGSKVGLPEIKSGLIPGMGGLTYLQSQIGAARTRRLVMLGDLIDAREACDLGIITHVVDEPFTAALALPEQLFRLETALQMKKILARQTAEHLTQDIDDWFQYLTQHEDAIDAERIAASGVLLKAKSMQNII